MAFRVPARLFVGHSKSVVLPEVRGRGKLDHQPKTLGKRILGIKIVTARGAPLSVGASTLRAAIFCVPYFLNGLWVGGSAVALGLGTFLIFGVGGSIVYLLLFNRLTRQSLHDLAVGAYVVSNSTSDSSRYVIRMWPGHRVAVGIILLLSLALPYFAQLMSKSVTFVELSSVQRAMQEFGEAPAVRMRAGA